jgi:replicative DNA helicase
LWINLLQRVEDGKIKRLMGLMPPGTAKALALDTPIPTPNGWAMMGNLKIGDQIFDETGSICKVTWVSPIWRDRPWYKVKKDCGDEIIADQDHEWLVSLYGRKYSSRVNKHRIRTTKDLATKRDSQHRRIVGARCKRPMILRPKALKLDEKDLIIDPYVLGAWLGDGTTAEPQITCVAQDIEWLTSELQRLNFKFNVYER